MRFQAKVRHERCSEISIQAPPPESEFRRALFRLIRFQAMRHRIRDLEYGFRRPRLNLNSGARLNFRRLNHFRRRPAFRLWFLAWPRARLHACMPCACPGPAPRTCVVVPRWPPPLLCTPCACPALFPFPWGSTGSSRPERGRRWGQL